MRAWQNADFARDWTNGPGIAAIDPPASLQDVPANDLAFQFLELGDDQLRIEALLDQSGEHGRLDLVDACVPVLLLDDAVSLGKPLSSKDAQAVAHRRELL